MIVILVGASGTGKDSVAKILKERYDYKTVISCTTRKPREEEIDGVDYHFISIEAFEEIMSTGGFVEVDKYSGDRYYGSSVVDYSMDCDCVKILTPNGVRQFVENYNVTDYYIVYLYSPLAVKCKRYIEREKKNFNIDMLIELMRRSIADEEMFRGFENVADLCIENDESCKLEEIADLIVKTIEDL